MIFPECQQPVYDLLESSKEDFYPEYVLKDDSKIRIDSLCKLADKLVESIDCRAFNISLNTPNKELIFIIVCYEIAMEDMSHPFYKAIKAFDRFSFSKYNDEYMQIKLYVEDLWEKSADW